MEKLPQIHEARNRRSGSYQEGGAKAALTVDAVQGIMKGDLSGAAMGVAEIALGKAKFAKKSAEVATETVQRWMSKAELEATQATGLLRGGRDGTHYVTDAANSNAKRARQRSALPQTPEVRVTLDVPAGKLSKPSRVEPAFNMPGGGMERIATGKIKVTIKKVD